MPRLYSTAQAAKLRGVHPRTVVRWIVEGKLQATRTAGDRGHWRIRIEDLLRINSDESDEPDEPT